MQTNNHQDKNQKLIEQKLIEKDKRSLSRHKGLAIAQAKIFLPKYSDFILKVISNNSLKIKHKDREGYFIFDKKERFSYKLSKRAKNKVYADFYKPSILPHELGHACNCWFDFFYPLSSVVILKDNKTLDDILKVEFEQKHAKIHEDFAKEYKDIINSNINSDAYDIIQKNIDLYRKLLELDYRSKEDKPKRKAIQKILYENGFVETYYLLVTKRCYSILNDKYSPIIDALTSKYDYTGLKLRGHDKEYYEYRKDRLADEFFANLFAAKVTGKEYCLSKIKQLLPESYEAFEMLFNIFYERIQKNKKFNDLSVRFDVDKPED